MLLLEDTFKLVQCYHCLMLADHLKSDCPQKLAPQTCGRCGIAGHSARDCSANPHCILCDEDGHPATARICRVYREKFTAQLAALRDPLHLNQPVTLNTSALSSAERALESLQSVAAASETTQDFLEAMFALFKIPPHGSCEAPSTSYDGDLENSISSTGSNPAEEEPSLKTVVSEVPPTPTQQPVHPQYPSGSVEDPEDRVEPQAPFEQPPKPAAAASSQAPAAEEPQVVMIPGLRCKHQIFDGKSHETPRWCEVEIVCQRAPNINFYFPESDMETLEFDMINETDAKGHKLYFKLEQGITIILSAYSTLNNVAGDKKDPQPSAALAKEIMGTLAHTLESISKENHKKIKK